MTSKGFEHVSGKTYLSLDDGRIIGGELVAPLTMVQDLRIGGQEEPQHSEYFALQELHLEILSPEEFDRGSSPTAYEGVFKSVAAKAMGKSVEIKQDATGGLFDP